MFLKRTCLAIAFICLCFPVHAQKAEVPISISLKTNPLQYCNKEANVSFDFEFGKNGLDIKGSFVRPVYLGIAYYLNIASKVGTGWKGHLMYRRYFFAGRMFLSLGVAYKEWAYDYQRFGDWGGSDESTCVIESRWAKMPGIKYLAGLRFHAFRKHLLVEPYAGLGLRKRRGKTTVHEEGRTLMQCISPGFTEYELEENKLVGAIYFGVNLGPTLIFGRKKRQ